jgi:hypothetical protein
MLSASNSSYDVCTKLARILRISDPKTIKSLTLSITALTTKIDKFSLPDYYEDEDESSEEE